MVGGPGDIMDTPPSARGFALSVLERGTGQYASIFKGTEENGYGFIIYDDGDKKLILKGRIGSDHKETIYAGSKELQNIRKDKYRGQDDMEFLRRTCLSGRSWLVTLQNKNYYFVAIWNTSITQNQYNTLKEYLVKFPVNSTYIQMGMAGSDPSSKFQLVSSFVPKIASEKPKLTKKEKDFVQTAHMKTAELPASYAKALKKLQSMTESNDTAMSNYNAYQSYKNYALKLIGKLEKIKQLGKSNVSASDIVTKSALDSVLIGLGKQFPELTTKLNGLSKYTFNSSDLIKLHQKGKIDVKNWTDASLKELTKKQWMNSMSTGVGDPDHPINNDVKHHVGKLKAENAEMAQSDITKIIDYSEKLQSMFSVDDNLEDWVKAKLNHACDYVATVRDYLKFYRDEKEAGTPEDQIDEKWSNTYKKSINCSNPKGFSQKAHCKARRLRQAGKHTKSKPVREIYEAVVRRMIKEFNSSMAMGALKQLNSDAKELETMLQPNTQLEDWVKAKLNLAGEYLDDVYHHLDHFGAEGRTLDENSYYKKYWFTPNGKVVDVGNSHEDWIKNNDKSLVGATLVDTYENAVAKGYVRGVFDIQSEFLTLSNLPNYDFLSSKLRRETKAAIEDFIIDKNIKIVATGKGKLLKDFIFNTEPQLAEHLLESIKLQEDWKNWLRAGAAGALGLAATTGNVDAAKIKQPSNPIVQSATKDSETSLLNKKTSEYIGHWEGKKDTVYKDSAGLPAIGIGHYLNNSQEDRQLFKALFGDTVNYDKVLNGQQKLTDDQIEKLFNVDVKIKEKLASKKISNFTSLPTYVKNAVINALYRGDIGPKTIGLMNSGDWVNAAKEYLNHKNAKSGPSQIQRRMNTNAIAFAQYAKNKNEYFGFNYYF
jgi:GH24 family phage-related lysozyme (muramidase)